MTETRVPIPTLERLAIYLRVLLDAHEAGIQTLSSQEVEQHSGINAAQFRKDLSYFGEFGKPGVGYSVAGLIQCIERILRLDAEQPILLVGAGNIGAALVGYPNFQAHRLRIAAVFDNNFVKIGRPFGDLVIEDIARIREINATIGARLGIIAVPASAAQEVADLLVEAGVTGILNFAPTILRVPPYVHVRNVSFLQELAVLSYQAVEESLCMNGQASRGGEDAV
ncbi:MAG: redox-sensing transcriptional repressor Rex [bacterium]|nr:redox-sensing transcriptional repressor Rex [bacterium]